MNVFVDHPEQPLPHETASLSPYLFLSLYGNIVHQQNVLSGVLSLTRRGRQRPRAWPVPLGGSCAPSHGRKRWDNRNWRRGCLDARNLGSVDIGSRIVNTS